MERIRSLFTVTTGQDAPAHKESAASRTALPSCQTTTQAVQARPLEARTASASTKKEESIRAAKRDETMCSSERTFHSYATDRTHAGNNTGMTINQAKRPTSGGQREATLGSTPSTAQRCYYQRERETSSKSVSNEWKQELLSYSEPVAQRKEASGSRRTDSSAKGLFREPTLSSTRAEPPMATSKSAFGERMKWEPSVQSTREQITEPIQERRGAAQGDPIRLVSVQPGVGQLTTDQLARQFERLTMEIGQHNYYQQQEQKRISDAIVNRLSSITNTHIEPYDRAQSINSWITIFRISTREMNDADRIAKCMTKLKHRERDEVMASGLMREVNDWNGFENALRTLFADRHTSTIAR